MEHPELMTDPDSIPQERTAVLENIAVLLAHATNLEGTKDLADPLPNAILDAVPAYVRRQLERLRLHIDHEPDILALFARNLMELHWMLRYMATSTERANEVVREQLRDLKDIETVLYPGGSPPPTAPANVKSFHADMTKLWESMRQYGVRKEELKGHSPASHYAQGAEAKDEYDTFWRVHSKYVHPSSYLLFGKRSFVYGPQVRVLFLVIAQHYAARILRDLHSMIRQAREHVRGA